MLIRRCLYSFNPVSNPFSLGRRRIVLILNVFFLFLRVLGSKRHFLVALKLISKLLNLTCRICLTSPKLYYHLRNSINIVGAIRPSCRTCLTVLALCWRINSPMRLSNMSVQHFYLHIWISSWSLSYYAISCKNIAPRRLRKSLILRAQNFWNGWSTTIRSFCLEQDLLFWIALNLNDRLVHLHLVNDFLKHRYGIISLLAILLFLWEAFFQKSVLACQF